MLSFSRSEVEALLDIVCQRIHSGQVPKSICGKLRVVANVLNFSLSEEDFPDADPDDIVSQ